MPIRFRCVYCDKLLGIATRKAGTVVNCPQCGQPLIVPSPEPQEAAASAPERAPSPAPPPPPAPLPAPAPVRAPAPVPLPPKESLFEQDDFDVVLATEPTFEPPPPRRSTNRQEPPRPDYAPQHFAVERSLPGPSHRAPAPLPLPLPSAGGLVLTPVKLVIALVLVFFLVGLAFGGGVLVGRMLNS